jgi:hypothetical protein
LLASRRFVIVPPRPFIPGGRVDQFKMFSGRGESPHRR